MTNSPRLTPRRQDLDPGDVSCKDFAAKRYRQAVLPVTAHRTQFQLQAIPFANLNPPTLSQFRWISRLLVMVVLLGCERSPDAENIADRRFPQLVVLYAPCTVNKSFLSPYNSDVTYTPHLESFANSATVFTKHRTEAGLSGIAYASILTGTQAPEHGVYAHPTRLRNSIYDITEAFAENGYDVFFWNHQRMGAADLNYGQAVPPENVFERVLQANDRDFENILQKLAEDRTYRAFLLVNFRVNHNPYRPDNLVSFLQDFPEERKDLAGMSQAQVNRYMNLYYKHDFSLRYDFERVRQEQRLTDEELANLIRVVQLLYKSNIPVLDQLFGGVVAKIDSAGFTDDSLIAFSSDHGESMFRPHAPFKWSHGHAVQSDVLDVPLIIRPPKTFHAASRCEFVTRSVDIFPTLAALAQLKLPAETSVSGHDLSKYMRPDQQDPEFSAYSHSGMVFPFSGKRYAVQKLMGQYLARYYPASDMVHTWVAIRRGDFVWKYRSLEDQTFIFQAFDVSQDPAESRNLFDATDPQHQEMSTELKRYKDNLVRSYREWQSAPPPVELGEREELNRLRSMGYVK